MKIFLKYSLLVATTLIFTVSCRDEDKIRMPEIQDGVNARVVVHSDKSVLNFLDITNASMVFDIYSQNSDIKEITYSATFTDATFPTQKFPTVVIKKVAGSAFANGKASDLQVTATELAAAFDLPGGATYLSGGDNFTFFSSVELNDGRIINAANSAPNITTGTNASFTSTFKLFVSCPFVVDEAVGTYTVVTDAGEWATAPGHEAEIVAGPGANQITVKNALGYPQEFDMIVDINPGTGAATVAKQVTWDADFWFPADGYGLGSTAGSGFFFSCSGFLTLDLGFTVAAGSFGTFKVEWQKN
ncbi:hypothetical protein [Chryseolinea lacunae]|uniref:DUF1735 domain-containing protein n=1 Tax=Chryseolinea lacunae TaxID=2801331 RepID=A0ABS1L0H3_9BACT|nr:hypothetical protein [Chryseolinea lacunae]MBL0745201.1 hypothetical protein [Chryseolinea lacunae]